MNRCKEDLPVEIAVTCSLIIHEVLIAGVFLSECQTEPWSHDPETDLFDQ